MKSTFLILFAFALYAQAEKVEILERGMHHKRVRVTDTYVDENGETRSRTSEYTELENGMHRRAADGSWVESNPTVEMLKDRAVVRGGPLELTFLPNANQDGAVTLTTPDGKVLRSHVLGMAYTDSVTGDSVMFAAIQDSCANDQFMRTS